jgi:SAM-dependent methyltransferase
MSSPQVEMPTPTAEGGMPTLNDYGWTSTEVHEYAQQFVELAVASRHWVLDVGCAYGAPVVAAIKGGARVIANDLDKRHLQLVQGQVPAELSLNLRIRQGAFPRIKLPAGCLGAINCSAVLHFMDGPMVDRSAARMYDLLVPGGKIFLLTMTPFMKQLPGFVAEFERRKSAGDRFPGYIDDVYKLMGVQRKDGQRKMSVNLFDLDVLSRPFAEAGFIIETAEYAKKINAAMSPDGRGAAALIARKP